MLCHGETWETRADRGGGRGIWGGLAHSREGDWGCGGEGQEGRGDEVKSRGRGGHLQWSH